MQTVLMIILAVISVFIVLVVLLQPSTSDGMSGSIAGGAEQVFGKKRGRGYETILHRLTIILAIIFMVLSLVLLVVAK